MIEPGQVIGNYEILEELGRGGMGVVYTARDTRLDRIVAVKTLPAYLSFEGEVKERFIREARAASALDHPNICTIHEIGETDDGELYIVMAYYEGESLDDMLRRGPLPFEQVITLARQLADALERAHGAGIVHRDLKCANIMVTKHGELKLLDFGLAKLASATDLTQTGTQLGTVSYMSPEQVDAKPVDFRTDIWAFGVVLYEMLAGRTPFEGETAQAVMFSIITKEPVSVRERRPDVPEQLEQIVDRCLQKDPDLRPLSAAALRAELSGPGQAGHLTAQRPGARANRRRIAVVASLVLAVATATGVFTVVNSGSDDSGVELSDDLVAVVPFTMRGSPEFGYLGDGIVDLISAKLAGVGTLSAADPRSIIAYVRDRGIDISDPDANRSLATHLGAGRYITGDMLEVRGRVTVTAYLHDTDEPGSEPVRAVVEGTAEGLFELVDGVVADLLVGTMTEATDRMQALATATTSSLGALKAYLEGERLLRGGEYRTAAEAYDRAVALDSTFALAYYRKAIAAEWIDAVDSRSAADRAFELAGNLPPRDREVLAALRLRRHGRNNESEQAFIAHLHQYPTDVEALVQLAEVLFHDNPRRGRPLTESMEPLRRALQVEPTNLIAQLHVARVYAFTDSIDALRRTVSYLAEIAPASERALEVEAIYAFAAGDSLQQQRVRDALDQQPWIYRFYAAHGVDRFARDTRAASDLLARRSENEPLLVTLAANLLVVQRRHDEFRRMMSALRDGRNPTWDLYEAFVVTSGTYEAREQELVTILDRVNRATVPEILSTSVVPPYEDVTPRYIEFERDYLAAMLLIQLDRVPEAERIIDRMRSAAAFAGIGSTQPDAVAELEAEVLYRAGDYEEALARLRTIEYEVPHAIAYRVVADGARSRFLRAELERQVGDPLAARSYYEGIDLSWSPWDSFYRPGAYLGLGRLAEDAGDLQRALRYYDRLIELWSDSDADFTTELDELRVLRDALASRLSTAEN